MTYTYNPILVGVSILVAIAGAYACFDLVIRVQRTTSSKRRNWLALAALAIGGSIWAMHFIAMLAVELPATMQYDILTTLVSGLVAILMTAAALSVVAAGIVNPRRIVAGGTVMGAGITAMHYVGMSGMRGNFELSYEIGWLLSSIFVGVFASTLSLWLAMGLQLRGVLRRLLSAIVMGLSIAGVHYCGMFGTQFNAISELASFTQPILSPFSMGLITALVTFCILGWALLMLLPATANNTASEPATEAENKVDTNKVDHSRDNAASTESATEIAQNTPAVDTTAFEKKEPSDSPPEKIPVQKNKKTYFIQIEDIASISADGHYSTVRTDDGQSHFCNVAFNKLLEDIPDLVLTRVHRSHAINLDSVVSFQRKHDKAIVNLGADEHEVPVSRTHVSMLQDVLGLSK